MRNNVMGAAQLESHGRMNLLPAAVCLMSLLDSALSSLPAPVNVSVTSVNFHHVLRWDPGPGSPPGTQYKIRRHCGKKRERPLNSASPSLTLKLKEPNWSYCLTVQASYNQSLSPQSRKVSFSPFRDTTIGPPQLSLAGCGSFIQINISLPEADRNSGVSDIQKFYNAQFRVLWRKRNKEVMSVVTQKRNFTLDNLENGTEYCVQVHTENNVNKNCVPSAWKCIFSSIVEPSRVPVISGVVSVLLILVVGGLMTFMYCLYNTGFLCKLEALPRTLIVVLSQGYTLTPEKASIDQIIISEVEKQRTHGNPTVPQPQDNEEEEEEEEEEEGAINVYMNRAAELSSGGSSCQETPDVFESRTMAACEDSGCLTAEKEAADAEFEVTYDGRHQDDAKDEGAEQTGVQVHVPSEEEEEEEEEEVEEVRDSSGNVNLFSVTLAALAVCEDEEEEEEEESSRDSLTGREPLLPRDSRQTLSQTDLQTESVASALPRQQDSNATGYEGSRANTLSGYLYARDEEAEEEEEEDEEEEEFSGYMRHT